MIHTKGLVLSILVCLLVHAENRSTEGKERDSKITTINSTFLRGKEHLTVLIIPSVGLERIEPYTFSNFTNLNKLEVSDNPLNSLDCKAFEGLRNLESLSIDGEFDNLKLLTRCFDFVPNLKELNVGENRFTKIEKRSFIKVRHLTKLILYRNDITYIEDSAFEGLAQLYSLSLFMNPLKYINKEMFKGLNANGYLSLSNCKLTNIQPGAFTHVKNWNIIYISSNNINHISSGTFLGLETLNKLYIEDNAIKRLESETFKGLDSLDELNLSDNEINYIVKDAFNYLKLLTVLYLSGNNIKKLPDGVFKNIPNIQKIQLTSGTWRRFSSICLPHLKRTFCPKDIWKEISLDWTPYYIKCPADVEQLTSEMDKFCTVF